MTQAIGSNSLKKGVGVVEVSLYLILEDGVCLKSFNNTNSSTIEDLWLYKDKYYKLVWDQVETRRLISWKEI
jgi:hypothetical protein